MNKKQTIITAVAIVLAFIVGYFVGDASAINRVNKQISSMGKIETNASNIKEEPAKEEVKEEIKTVKLNEQSVAGNLGIKVLEAKESTAISNEAGKSTPSGKFIVIKLEIKNNGKEPTEYNTNDFKLKNKDILYQVDDNSFGALGDLNSQETIYNENKKFIGAYDKFNAGITKNTYIVFDIPKEAKLADLKLLVKQNKSIEFSLK
ncbi:hypothetical protein BD780_003219 [Clostridium tetanomorphum]|uniref:DUF4352 domain-containing protein n=1 Tax=Clostridium tetanomorphum TaxID=1553 RepID=A0A923J294_CLOTT|nr:DUF4352 domain-containing protein [Clostridium tetanomorphum]KAJ53616.1 hypothetical protein CTM_01499 [Clostridium tetanomorphum DSM 665]MBC2399609.1 DUF4352 domain-containing protein [Clostridium tetanomorphum]MBP1866262.1 hypothetical protein [Clostridium tetanomorphum]NRS85994.1 hypothetical protein [Clostridium tetanomorphum]NRZ95996.1 hypothetical protein [Clostridium tetanomorphum]